MRHKRAKGNLNRNTSLKKATLRDIARSVIKYESVKTTKVKAKAARRLVEKLITLGKKNTLSARRIAFKILIDHRIVSHLFTEIAPRFSKREGGYTRILNITSRRGDNAQRVILELTELKEKPKPASKQKAAVAEQPKKSKEEPKDTSKKIVKEKPEVKKQESKIVPDEKVQKKKHETKEKKQAEEKPKKKFFSGLRKFMKKERDSK